MAFYNFLKCEKVFIQNGKEQVCKSCQDAEVEQFKLVAIFLRDNPRATLDDIRRGTGIEEKVILRFLKEGRLSVKIFRSLSCENCGLPIEKGMYCENCRKELSKKIKKIKGDGPKN